MMDAPSLGACVAGLRAPRDLARHRCFVEYGANPHS